MLAYRRQLSQHRNAAFWASKGITVIAELDRLERRFQGKLPETGENLFHIDGREADFAAPGIAILTSKEARLSNGNKHTLRGYHAIHTVTKTSIAKHMLKSRQIGVFSKNVAYVRQLLDLW